MDVLAHLESRVEQLLARLEKLKSDLAVMEAELFGLKQENAELAVANRDLKEAQLRSDALRLEALRRLETLLRRIRDYGIVE